MHMRIYTHRSHIDQILAKRISSFTPCPGTHGDLHEGLFRGPGGNDFQDLPRLVQLGNFDGNFRWMGKTIGKTIGFMDLLWNHLENNR